MAHPTTNGHWNIEGQQWLQEQLRSAGDRDGANNPVALLQFASGDTVPLLRAHKTKTWLPETVKKVLRSSLARKACLHFDEKVASLFVLPEQVLSRLMHPRSSPVSQMITSN